MVFRLRAFDGSGNNLGTISIFANNGTDSAGFGWEWIGNGMNTGGNWEWYHNGNGYTISLYENGYRFGGLISPDWGGSSNPNGFPAIPWFSQNRANAGIGSRIESGPPPQRLLPGFNWQLL